MINKIKNTVNTIGNSWTLNHKMLLFSLSLLTAMLFQSFATLLPSLPTEVIAYEAVRTEFVSDTDTISTAKTQLENAKKLLTAEEALLLSEIDAHEKRLEEIREIKMSFSQAPDQQN